MATSYISGVGYAVPPKIVPNSYFETYLDTTDQWIRERTGIGERRWAEPNVLTSDLAYEAVKMALENAKLAPTDIDGIIFATVTPDYLFPSAACMLQKHLGIKQCFAVDVNAACAGFIYALTIADAMIKSGTVKNLLVVGADLLSRLIDPKDRSTCVLFGDGAGALILSRNVQNTDQGIIAAALNADGEHSDILFVPNWINDNSGLPNYIARNPYLFMSGKEVFKNAVRSLASMNMQVIKQAGLSTDDITYFVAHQANQRIIDAIAKQLELPDERFLSNVEKYGNTSAASVPLLLAEAVTQGKIHRGDVLALSAFGGGLAYGAILLRY